MRRMIILLNLLVILFCSSCGIEQAVIQVPENYEGTIVIVFNQEDGVSEEYNDNGERVYRIPNSGILKTRFKSIKGISTLSLHTYSDASILEELPLVYSFDEVDQESTQTIGYNPRIGAKVERYDQSGNLIKAHPPYMDLLIGRMSKIDSLSKVRDDFIFKHVYDR